MLSSGSPRKGRGGARSSVIAPLKGLFVDGVWHCDCNPRLRAAYFQTKNGGVNHGRWFYICQRPQDSRCKFFLWDDDARSRDTPAVPSNPRSEPLADSASTSGHTPAPLSSPPPYTVVEAPYIAQECPAAQNPGNVNRQTLAREQSYNWDLDGEDERRVVQVADDIAGEAGIANKRAAGQRETPRKVVKAQPLSTPRSRERSPCVTPRTVPLWPTPSTARGGQDIFTSPRTKASEGGPSNGDRTFQLVSPSVTPTPIRFKDVDPGSVGDTSLSEEVLEVLEKKYELDNDTKGKIKTICNRHSLRSQGIAKGRDISRLAIKAKEVKIEELEHRVASLEAENEKNQAMIRSLKRQIPRETEES